MGQNKRQYALVVGLRVTNGNLIPNGIHHPPIEDGRLLPNSVKEPIAQLNKYTDFKIDYELIKKGHTYTNIKFLLTRTMSVPVPYKQEQRPCLFKRRRR